jgi:PAS domain S-box-containing protein
MSQPLAAIVVTDRPEDARRWIDELHRGGFAPAWRRVAEEGAFVEAIVQPPELILAAAAGGDLDARRLLEIVRERALDVPVIVLSDAGGAELAVEIMQRGAADYVLRDQLARLAPAAARALDERRLRSQRRSTEASLRASEERLRLALDGGQMGMWEYSVATGQSVWNAREYELLGLPVGDGNASSELFFQRVHPEDVGRVQRDMARCLETGDDFDSEMRIIRSDGQIRWLLGRARVNRGPDGRPSHLIGVNYDITERKLAEERLRESEDRLRTIVNSEPACVKLIDAEGRLLEMNSAGLAMIEADSAEHVLGHRVQQLIVPEHREAFLAMTKQVFAGQTATLSFEIVGLKGTRRRLESHVSPLRDAAGNVIAALSVTRDITAHVQAEAAVRDSQRMLETVMNNIPQGVFWKDRQSVYLGCNRVALRARGFDRPEQIIGKRDSELPGLTPEEAAFFYLKDQEVMDSDRPQLGIIEPMTLHDGTTIWLETSKIPMHDAEGKVVGVLGTWQDITERRRLEEQLRQSQKMDAIGQLAGGVAHDFNNLLTVILGYSELALASLDPSAEARDHVAAIRDAGERAAALTRHLLAFSRKQMLEPKEVDLNDVVAGSEKMLRRLIGENITLATVLAPTLPKVRVDPSQLEQVILNLTVNARDAMPAGGRLYLETHLDEAAVPPASDNGMSRGGKYVRLTVRDTGTGIPPDVQPRIFEPFFTTKPPGRGTGLGLATVYGIVQQSGGWIDVKSEVGAGTAFNVYLPVVAADRSSGGKPDAASAVAGEETILLVEDDAAVRVLTRQSLERLGYRILEAEGACEALRIAEAWREPIDLLITDVVMPDRSGRELAESLVARRPRMRVLFVSGYNEDALLRQGIAHATSNYLQKPFALVALAKRVREILNQQD